MYKSAAAVGQPSGIALGLPQMPWAVHHVGPLLVISLFDGQGALFVALLAMGATVQAVAVECEATAREVC